MPLSNAMKKQKDAYEQAMCIDPKCSTYFYKKGEILLEMQRYEEALQAYDQALTLDPEYTLASVGKCDALEGLQRYEEVLSICEQATTFGLHHLLANRKGNAFYALDRYEEAKDAYDQAIALDPDCAQLTKDGAISFNNKVQVLLRLQQYEDALTVIDQALSCDSSEVEYSMNKAAAYLALKRPEDALTVIEQVIGLDPEYAAAYTSKGQIHEVLAREAFDTAKRITDVRAFSKQETPDQPGKEAGKRQQAS